MLLTITNRREPATDLGYLLHKHPAKLQTYPLTFGQARVFYPGAGDDCCTIALWVEVDPIALVRNRRGPAGEGFSLQQYVNDRPYSANSFLSVAIAEVFGTALSGRCKDRDELVATPLQLTARIGVLPCRGGEGFLRRLFEPLGYLVTATRLPLDEQFPEWGESSYFTVELSGLVRLQDLLAHLYVLVPVLDDDKHYWVGPDEVDKLLRHGESWLASHPERDAIVERYLKRQRSLTRDALARLPVDDASEPDDEDDSQTKAIAEEAVETPIRLNELRLQTVIAVLKGCGANRVLDLGCNTGNLLRRLLDEPQFTEIVGMDVSHRVLEIATDKLHLDRLPERQRKRIKLMQGSLTYRDARLNGYDAAALIEVIEHLDPPRLAALERVLFEFARPGTVVVTTPNVEYNVHFAGLAPVEGGAPGKLRHADHRFEWTRAEFQTWSSRVAERFGYRVRFLPVGDDDLTTGPPTQMAVFDLVLGAESRSDASE